MSQSPPASGDQAQAGPAPSPNIPSAAHVQDTRAERANPHHSHARRYHASGRVDFDAINRAALPLLPAILQRLLPNGRREGKEYVALNPRRADRHPGSFRINLANGRWADFALADKSARGGDPISLVAYVLNIKQSEAARGLMRMLGMDARQ
jgi:hypothetical protein